MSQRNGDKGGEGTGRENKNTKSKKKHPGSREKKKTKEKEKKPGVKSFKSCLRNKQTKRQRPRERESRCFSAPVINIRLMIRF